MENSTIEWTHHTFNPWMGCAHKSEGCDNCYAETSMDKRYKKVKWGHGQPRSRTSEGNWKLPLRWDRQTAALGERARVFCASLADVFDDEVPEEWRQDLWELIESTPNLDWLLLTKRPENYAKFLSWLKGGGDPWQHVWLGTSTENQQRFVERVPILLNTPAAIRFISPEPLLGPITMDQLKHREQLDWVIVGGESGPGSRPMEQSWAKDLRDQCLAKGVAYFFKQWGGVNKKATGRLLEGRTWDEVPH